MAKFPISKPGTASKNKTGAWRTFRAVINKEKCIKCQTCVMVCPEGCIKGEPGKIPEIDYDYCKGCGICAFECPVKCIEMIPEKEVECPEKKKEEK